MLDPPLDLLLVVTRSPTGDYVCRQQRADQNTDRKFYVFLSGFSASGLEVRTGGRRLSCSTLRSSEEGSGGGGLSLGGSL